MKKIILYVIGWGLLAFACSVDNDYIFDDISTTRLNQYIDECDATLLSSAQGWKFVYNPDTTQYGSYTFLMKFREGKRVMMISDFDQAGDTTVSAYSFNAAVGPILNFSTYSLLHLLADPMPEVAGGKAGLGYGGEYEFLITGVEDNRISLLGKKNKWEAALVRATAEDWEDMALQREAIGQFYIDPRKPFYNYLEMGNDTAFFYYSPKLRMAYLTYVRDGETVAERLPVHSSVNGICFDRPVTFGGQTFSEVSFDRENYMMSIVDEGVTGRFFRAQSNTERCLIHFPEGVELAKEYDAFSLVERGAQVSSGGRYDLVPEGHNIEEFRFYWNLDGECAGEVYIRENSMITCAKLLKDYVGADLESDQVTFGYLQRTKIAGGIPSANTQLWFGFDYARDPKMGGGPMTGWLCHNDGLTVIPVGEQFYMVLNADNLAWALFTPLEENK